MTALEQLLPDALADAQKTGVHLAPAGLLAHVNALQDPIAAMVDGDRATAMYETLNPDLEFLDVLRASSKNASEAQRGAVASIARWLIDGLEKWRKSDDNALATLAAMLTTCAKLDQDGLIWQLLPDSIATNLELGQELAAILAGMRVDLRLGFTRRPIADGEALAELLAAERGRDWPALRHLAEDHPFQFWTGTLIRQSTRLLNRFFPSHLANLPLSADSLGIAMEIVTAIPVNDALRAATATGNEFLQFAAVCRLTSHMVSIEVLSVAEEEALVGLLKTVSAEPERWHGWMKAFAAYPNQTAILQPAIGTALASAPEAALAAYFDGLVLIASGVSRPEIAACLSSFAASADLERRQAAWRIAFDKWSAWEFGRFLPHAALVDVSVSNIDYAIVGYAVECLNQAEVDAEIQQCWQSILKTEQLWHKSSGDMALHVRMALSRLQPFAHATGCGADRAAWLSEPNRTLYFDPLRDAYWQHRFWLRRLGSGGDEQLPPANEMPGPASY